MSAPLPPLRPPFYVSSQRFTTVNYWGGGGGANPIFPIFPIPILAKSTFISGKSGNSFSPISPSLITLGHMLIHNLYIKVLIALILVYRNSM